VETLRSLLTAIVAATGLIAASAHAETIKVEPGVNGDIGAQAAFSRAQAGDKIVFGKGRFDISKPLVLNASDVEIRGEGADKTTLSFALAPTGADAIRVNGNGIVVRDLAIEDAKGAALGASGSNILIEKTAVRRAAGPGIVIVSAQGAIVRNSSAEGAQAGFGVQNSSRVAVMNNAAASNGVGVVVVNRPGAAAGAGVRVERNRIVGNSGEGVGVEITAGKDVAILNNEIGEHGTANVLVRAFGGSIPSANFSATPGNITIANNKLGRAGFAPSRDYAPASANGAVFGDIVWDGARTYVAGGVPRTEPVLFAIEDNRRTDGAAPRFLSLGLMAAGSPASEAAPSAQWPLLAKIKPPADVKID
jgi:hypothetical protein